jgi:hypothetical protein
VNKSVAYIRIADGTEHRLRILKKIAKRNRQSKSKNHAVGSGPLPLEPMHVDASPAPRFRMFGDDQRVGQWPRRASLSPESPSQSWPGGLIARSLHLLARGRVLRFASVDASIGIVLVKTSKRAVRLQADVLNLTDRLNVIDFAGVFSGTALAPPRSVAIRLQAAF